MAGKPPAPPPPPRTTVEKGGVDPITKKSLAPHEVYARAGDLVFESEQSHITYYKWLEAGYVVVYDEKGEPRMEPDATTVRVWTFEQGLTSRSVLHQSALSCVLDDGKYEFFAEAPELEASMFAGTRRREITVEISVVAMDGKKIIDNVRVVLAAGEHSVKMQFTVPEDMTASAKMNFVSPSLLTNILVRSHIDKMTTSTRQKDKAIKQQMMDMMQPDEYFAEIKKDARGIGMTLGWDTGRKVAAVKSITPGGVVDRLLVSRVMKNSPKLINLGDAVRAVQGQRVDNLSYPAIVDLLKSVPLRVMLIMKKAPSDWTGFPEPRGRPAPPPPSLGQSTLASVPAPGRPPRRHEQGATSAPPPPRPPRRTDSAPQPPQRQQDYASAAPKPPSRQQLLAPQPPPRQQGFVPQPPPRQQEFVPQPPPRPQSVAAQAIPAPAQPPRSAPTAPVALVGQADSAGGRKSRPTAPPPPEAPPRPVRAPAPPAPARPSSTRGAAPPTPVRPMVVESAPPQETTRLLPAPPVFEEASKPMPIPEAVPTPPSRQSSNAIAAPPIRSPSPASQPQMAPSSDEFGPEFAKYVKMKRAGLPDGAIVNAMNRDGVAVPRGFFPEDFQVPHVVQISVPKEVSDRSTPLPAAGAAAASQNGGTSSSLMDQLKGFNSTQLKRRQDEPEEQAPPAKSVNPLLAELEKKAQGGLRKRPQEEIEEEERIKAQAQLAEKGKNMFNQALLEKFKNVNPNDEEDEEGNDDWSDFEM